MPIRPLPRPPHRKGWPGLPAMAISGLASLPPAWSRRGDRVEARPHRYTDGEYLRISDPAGGAGVLVFETDGRGDDAKVVAWRVGLAPQVDYVEGCS